MSSDHIHVALRQVAPIGLATPLLVPSFSSRGFPDLAVLYDAVHADLYGVCLLSAFDLSTHKLSVDLSEVTDVVLLDSGAYETKPPAVALDPCDPPPAHDWTRDSYHTCLRKVPADANVIAVSFDHYGAIEQQIDLAMEDFAVAPRAASDFLLKPSSLGKLVEVRELHDHVHGLSGFDVLGVTEEELGCSHLDRCRNIIALREALTRAGLDLPIHIFGTITPGVVLSYFLCGADIFDGLNWLRFVYGPTSLRPIAEAALDGEGWDEADGPRFLRHAVENLHCLRRLQHAMRSYCATGDLEVLCRAFPIAERAAHAALAASGRSVERQGV